MKNTQTLVITDTRKIKSIKFKFPELVSPDAEDIIKADYQSLLELKDKLQEYRIKALETEKLVKEATEDFNEKTKGCTIEFETYEKKYTSNKASIFIKGQGNDILGTFGN